MCLYWGVHPLDAPHFADSHDLLQHVAGWARKKSLLNAGDRVVLIAGSNWTPTEHNMIVVSEVN